MQTARFATTTETATHANVLAKNWLCMARMLNTRRALCKLPVSPHVIKASG